VPSNIGGPALPVTVPALPDAAGAVAGAGVAVGAFVVTAAGAVEAVDFAGSGAGLAGSFFGDSHAVAKTAAVTKRIAVVFIERHPGSRKRSSKTRKGAASRGISGSTNGRVGS